MKRRSARGGLVLCAGLALAGCSWVSLSEGGKAVRVAEPKGVSGCQTKGHATAQTRDKLWIFARREPSIREELESLARNEAAQMGGDAITAAGPIERGRQTFDVYRCAK